MSLRQAFGRAEFVRSLRTNDHMLARSRSRRLYLQSEAMFGSARGAPMLNDQLISVLVRRFYVSELDAENEIRVATGVQFDEANQLAAIAFFERLRDDARGALARNELGRANRLVDDLLRTELPSADIDDISRAKLQQGVLRATCEVANALGHRFEGLFDYQPSDQLVAGSASKPVTETGPAAAPQTTPVGPLFSERAEIYRTKRERLGTWDRQTALQARKTFALFAELCGDRPVGGYVRADAVRFKDALIELPANYGKAAEFRGLSIAEIIERIKASSIRRLSARTVQRHLSALSCLWDEAVEAEECPAQIFGGFKLPAAKRAKDQRAMWTTEQLKQLFDTPVWQGCATSSRRAKPGHVIIRDEKFWLPLIGLYSGMRQEEICQLHLDDVRQTDGVWIFDINDAPPRQLKNRNAARLVPIHAALLAIGFIDFVERARAEGQTRLFPQLKPGGADQRFGHNFTKWFTRYRRDVGVYEEGRDFHSLRHSATTFLIQANVQPAVVDALTGHETAGETARYTKQYRIEQLKMAIDALDPGLALADFVPTLAD